MGMGNKLVIFFIFFNKPEHYYKVSYIQGTRLDSPITAHHHLTLTPLKLPVPFPPPLLSSIVPNSCVIFKSNCLLRFKLLISLKTTFPVNMNLPQSYLPQSSTHVPLPTRERANLRERFSPSHMHPKLTKQQQRDRAVAFVGHNNLGEEAANSYTGACRGVVMSILGL